MNYFGLDDIIKPVCPNCKNPGTIIVWDGEVEKHCNKCGLTWDRKGKDGKPK